MTLENSDTKSALVITRHNHIFSHIKSVISRFDIIIHTEYESLSSVKVIKKAISETTNTVFIRKAFSRFINDWGLPSFILLDYRIDLGIDSAPDHDQRKLLRTFLISYIIMSQKAEYSDMSTNFILFAETNDLMEAREFENDPMKILDILDTANETINNVINTIKQDPGRIKRIFKLKVVPVERAQDDLEKTIHLLLKQAPPGVSSSPANTGRTEESELLGAAKQADNRLSTAIVAFRINDKIAYINNKPGDIEKNKYLKELAHRQFYIIGSCNNKNQHDVGTVIRQAVKNGYDNFAFSATDEIVINLTNSCIIDSTAISLLGGLFTNDLAKFKNKIINVNFKNACTLEKSKGYIVIRKYIRHAY